MSKRRFNAGTEARRQARNVIGTVPRVRVIPDKRKKPAKHKKNLNKVENNS